MGEALALTAQGCGRKGVLRKWLGHAKRGIPRSPAAAGPSKRRVSILSHTRNGKGYIFVPDLTLGAGSDRNAARLGGRSRDVLGDQPRHVGWLLHIRQMARAFDDLKPRAFDQPRSLSHQGHWGGAVLVA